MIQIFTEIIFVINLLFIIFIAAISHELAHGYMAYHLGDPTPKVAGRLTINPLKHIDLFGTIIFPVLLYFAGFIPLILFKPVPINPIHFKHPNKDSVKVALAGPGINLLYVFLAALFFRFTGLATKDFDTLNAFELIITRFGIWFIFVNLIIASFNLIPIPPLDGSWVLNAILPLRLKFYFQQFRTYFMIIFIILVITGQLSFLFKILRNFFLTITLWIIGG